MKDKVWQARFSKELDPRVHALNSSLTFDNWLGPYDVRVSIVWAKALHKCGVLDDKELAKIVEVELDDYNFIKTNPLSPVDTLTPGIFVCGCAESPMDVPESVAQASSAAARAAEIVFQSDLEKEKAVA